MQRPPGGNGIPEVDGALASRRCSPPSSDPPGRTSATHEEHIDVDVELSALLAGVFGTPAWMSELGRRGGRVSSVSKARAARANGVKGDRPRKGTH